MKHQFRDVKRLRILPQIRLISDFVASPTPPTRLFTPLTDGSGSLFNTSGRHQPQHKPVKVSPSRDKFLNVLPVKDVRLSITQRKTEENHFCSLSLKPPSSDYNNKRFLHSKYQQSYFPFYSFSFIKSFPPESKASTEVANLTARKYRHTLVFGVKESVCLSKFLTQKLLHWYV